MSIEMGRFGFLRRGFQCIAGMDHNRLRLSLGIDQFPTIAGIGVVLETRSVDALGNVTKTRIDGGGRTLETYDQEDRWEPVSTMADFEWSPMAKGRLGIVGFFARLGFRFCR